MHHERDCGLKDYRVWRHTKSLCNCVISIAVYYHNIILAKEFHGRKISLSPCTCELQKHFIIANAVKVAISSMGSLTQEKKIRR